MKKEKGKELSFWDHLEELRRRIIFSIVYFVIFSGALYPFTDKIIKYITSPIGKTYFFAPQEALFIRIKMAMVLGFFVAIPFILHQIWLFVSPALTKEEHRYSLTFLFAGGILFYGGAYIGYSIFTPFIIRVLMQFKTPYMEPIIGISKYFSLILWISGGMGVAFELPVITFILTKLGIVTPGFLLKQWRYMIVGILIFAAVITPTIDIVTMTIVSIPLFFLYFVSILTSFLGR